MNNRNLPPGKSKKDKDRKAFYFGHPAKGLFGQHKYPQPSRMVIITEGEDDTPAARDLIRRAHPKNLAYKVVSLRDGAGKRGQDAEAPTVKIGFLESIDWLELHEKVVFCFDQDEIGQEYARACAAKLTPGKSYIMTFSENDANAMLDAGKHKEFYTSIANAEQIVAEGIVKGGATPLSKLMQPIVPGLQLPYPQLQNMTQGWREGELIIITAPSGMGKTTVCREVFAHFIKTTREPMACMHLEEPLIKTQQGLMAIDLGIPLFKLRQNPMIAGQEALQASYNRMINNGRTYFYNHSAGITVDTLLAKLRFYHEVFGCKTILLDHLSLVISGSKSSREGERKDIDTLMTKLFQFVEQTGIRLACISHLTANKAKGSFNEGAPISLDDLRGSGSIAHLCHGAWAVEGNQHGPTPNERIIRVLKNREVGSVGRADTIQYQPTTGRLITKIEQQEQLKELPHHEF